MNDSLAFQPYTSQNLATDVAASASALLGAGYVVRLYNNNTFPVFVRIGPAGIAAVATDVGIPPNGVAFLSKLPNMQAMAPNMNGPMYIAALSPGGVGSLNIQTGEFA